MISKYTTVLLFVVLFIAGCQSNLTAKKIQAKNPMAKNSAKTPTKFVDVWNNYAQSTSDGKVMRGIAGRIHFYADSEKKRAVKVDGNVTVFVFDADEKDPARSKPLRVYQFKADSLPKHYAFKKPLGHGYDFFLPYDELGGEELRLCVMTRFDDRLEDNFVLSQPVNTILQGTKPEPTLPNESVREYLASKSIMSETNRKMAEQVVPSEMNPIQQVGYENVGQTMTTIPETRSVTTITLNDSMSRRLAQGPETTASDFSTSTAPITSPEKPEPEKRPKASPYDTKNVEVPKAEFPKPPF